MPTIRILNQAELRNEVGLDLSTVECISISIPRIQCSLECYLSLLDDLDAPLAEGHPEQHWIGITTPTVIDSPWHDLSGLATFTLACVGMLGVSSLVRRSPHAAAA